MNCFIFIFPRTLVVNFPLSKPLISTSRLQSLFYLLNYPLFFAAHKIALSALELLTVDWGLRLNRKI